MTLIVLRCDSLIPYGTPVIYDVLTQKASAYDPNLHSPTQIYGVSYPVPTESSGRAGNNYDGPIFYSNDFVQWTSVLTNTGVENPDFVGFNFSTERNDYVVVCIHGMAPVLLSFSSAELPSHWKTLGAFENETELYLL